MKDRAALIKMGVANGFRDIKDIQKIYNYTFATGGFTLDNKEEQKKESGVPYKNAAGYKLLIRPITETPAFNVEKAKDLIVESAAPVAVATPMALINGVHRELYASTLKELQQATTYAEKAKAFNKLQMISEAGQRLSKVAKVVPYVSPAIDAVQVATSYTEGEAKVNALEAALGAYGSQFGLKGAIAAAVIAAAARGFGLDKLLEEIINAGAKHKITPYEGVRLGIGMTPEEKESIKVSNGVALEILKNIGNIQVGYNIYDDGGFLERIAKAAGKGVRAINRKIEDLVLPLTSLFDEPKKTKQQIRLDKVKQIATERVLRKKQLEDKNKRSAEDVLNLFNNARESIFNPLSRPTIMEQIESQRELIEEEIKNIETEKTYSTLKYDNSENIKNIILKLNELYISNISKKDKEEIKALLETLYNEGLYNTDMPKLHNKEEIKKLQKNFIIEDI